MALVTQLKNVTAAGTPDTGVVEDTVVVEKVRWSLRQRYRKQLHLLSTDFFDEVDDFLFSSGRGGQLTNDGAYLKSMRELRAKQALFEEKFLERAIAVIKASSRNERAADFGATDRQSSTAAYESVEIDLALQAMKRKAERAYFQPCKQIETLQGGANATDACVLVKPGILIEAVIEAFAVAQPVFALPLEVRLLFIKLFEQHFVLKMEKLFLDTISIINNMNDPAFVEKLYSSSSAFRVQKPTTDASSDKTVIQSRSVPPVAPPASESKSVLVERTVEQLIKSICDQHGLPEFIDTMIRKQWRQVIFLIGLHRGTVSTEWSEAKHNICLLATAAAEKMYLEPEDYASIKDHLRQGFSLIQLGWQDQENFFQALADYFQVCAPEMGTGNTTFTRIQKSGLEASISPSGEELLDQEDLDEIAKLLGGDEDGEKKQLEDYLADVDALDDQVMVDFMLDGAYVQCLLTRNASNPGQYVISKRGARVSVTRSRLGLAVALQSGELRMPQNQFMRPTPAHTVLESSSRTRH